MLDNTRGFQPGRLMRYDKLEKIVFSECDDLLCLLMAPEQKHDNQKEERQYVFVC